MLFKTRKWAWRHFLKNQCCFLKNPKQSSLNDYYMKFHYYKITLQGEGDENYCFNYVEFHPFDVGDEFLDLGMNRFEEGKNDKNHDVPYKQIT